MATNTFLSSVDTEKVQKLMEETDENVKYFESVSSETAKKYTKHLDEKMQELYKKMLKVSDITTSELERYLLELTNLVYFMGDKMESLGIYDDMSSSAAKEVFNKAYLNTQSISEDGIKTKKLTVADLTAMSEEEAKYETVVNSIYARAYKMVKFKVESANKMIDTLKKVLSRRIQEEALSAKVQVDVGQGDLYTDYEGNVVASESYGDYVRRGTQA